jgi:hypothetical protein
MKRLYRKRRSSCFVLFLGALSAAPPPIRY